MKKKIKLSARIKDYLIQSILLAFSVLLALVLNEWRQSIKTDDVIDRVKSSIISEVQHNQKTIEEALKYHDMLIKNLLENNHLIDSIPVSELGVDFTASEKVLKDQMYNTLIQMNGFPDKYNFSQVGENHFIVQLDNFNVTIKVEDEIAKFYGVGNIQLKPADVFNTTWQTAQATNALVLLDYQTVDLFADVYRKQEQYAKLTEKILDMLYTGNQGIIPALQDLRNKEKYLSEKYVELLSVV
ncbi:hypothetical protein E1176_00505, partial [Fulvivirga sp. RKSG066]|uniref:hypothetical protein n=1 Tax=Fulvivirga aurantia TaxID=2529383 RepID=UPI0012BD6AF7